MGSEYNPEIYKVMAILLEDNKTIVHGYLAEWENQHRSVKGFISKEATNAKID